MHLYVVCIACKWDVCLFVCLFVFFTEKLSSVPYLAWGYHFILLRKWFHSVEQTFFLRNNEMKKKKKKNKWTRVLAYMTGSVLVCVYFCLFIFVCLLLLLFCWWINTQIWESRLFVVISAKVSRSERLSKLGFKGKLKFKAVYKI